MDTLIKIYQWLKTLPVVGKVFSILIITLMCILILFFSSCGTTRAIVHNGAHGTSTEIKITTNNPTTVTASPNVSLNTSSK